MGVHGDEIDFLLLAVGNDSVGHRLIDHHGRRSLPEPLDNAVQVEHGPGAVLFLLLAAQHHQVANVPGPARRDHRQEDGLPVVGIDQLWDDVQDALGFHRAVQGH